MPCATRFDDGFCRAVARADHQIVLVEIELLDGGGKERQAVAIEAVDARQVLKRGRAGPHPLDRRRHAARYMEERQQVGGWIRLAQKLEDLLAATHAGEPVVHQNDLQDNTSP
jgi:hypothetical protein